MARRAVGHKFHSSSAVQIGSSVPVEAIVKQYLPLINKFAFKFGIGTDLVPDLINTGVVALLEAHARFVSSKNAQFGTYAYHCIRGAMLNYIKAENSHGGVGSDFSGVVSLEHPLGQTDSVESDSPQSFHDIIGEPMSEANVVERIDRQTQTSAVKSAVKRLTTRERTVIRVLFFEDGTQRRAALLMNVSEPRVSALVRTSLRKLKANVA